MPVNKQLNIVCEMIHSDPNISGGFHLVGFSQGGLFVRALAQRCPPSVLGSVISIGGPQQGVFGMPFCPNATSLPLCSFLRNMLSKAAYTDFVQSRYVHLSAVLVNLLFPSLNLALILYCRFLLISAMIFLVNLIFIVQVD